MSQLSGPARRTALHTGRGGLVVLALAAMAPAQSYEDLRLVRGRPSHFASTFEFRVGAAGSISEAEDESLRRENKIGLDGHAYYHNERFSSQAAHLDAYAGRDGAVVSIRQNGADGSASRIELDYRYAPFYREGIYRNDDFIPTGLYEGDNYGAYLGFGRIAGQGLHVEVGPYVRKYTFDANSHTAASYSLPDDFLAYGIRAFAEHNTLQLDGQTGRPSDGFILTVRFEAERNDSDATFGTPLYQSRLPSGLWRARAHLEWFVPQRDLGTWAFQADAGWSDDDDRINNYDAIDPIGHMWVDGELGVRWDFGSSGQFAVTPFVGAQWVRALQENGAGTDEEFFFGGGARMILDLGDAMSLYADYSYSQNESRAPVSTVEDVLGEHQFFVGIELRVGARRY